MSARPMTPEEHRQGYAICECEKFAFLWRASLLRYMPQGYHGELCEECSTWTCSAEKIRLAEAKMREEASAEGNEP